VTAPRWDEEGPTPVRLPDPVLSVDPERIDDLLAQLRGVIDEVASLEGPVGLFMVNPPGRDEVSVNAARQATVMMERARHYLAEWRRQLIQTMEALEAQRDAYRGADTAARA